MSARSRQSSFALTPHGDVFYEMEGDPQGPTLILIAGLSAQYFSWHPELRSLLAGTGFCVVSFDNRDSGESFGSEDLPSYGLKDLAADTVALMDALEITAAHVVGQSMGGMVAQELALGHADRVLSLASIYSCPSPDFISKDPQLWALRTQEPARDREGAIAQFIAQEQLSGLAEFSPAWIRGFAERYVDRGWRPEGVRRQTAAVLDRPDRTQDLAGVVAPTLVLHGREDRLIPPEGGIATYAAIPGSELRIYPEMGHQLLPSMFPEYVSAIARNAARGS